MLYPIPQFAAFFALAPALALLGGPTYDTPESASADPDFAFQGEYVGEVDLLEGDPQVFGVQIVALGQGRFSAVSYFDGLPGEGKGDYPAEEYIYTGERSGQNVVFRHDRYVGTLDGRELRVEEKGQHVGTLRRKDRQSPTLGKNPPEGAAVLFNGLEGSVSNWKPGARLTGDGLLMQGVLSHATFRDHTIHVEFRLPFEPEARGQGRGNSGLYLQGRYEVQMLDSFGLSGEDNECGGVYRVARPKVNMCYPPLAWQTYDVKFTAARFDANGEKTANAKMTVWHNGVLIHEDLEIPGPTAAAPVRDEKGPGPVYLQDHGNPVRYRNIWVVPND